MEEALSPESSAELLARWRAGDQEAASRLWRRYAVRLVALARSRLSAEMHRHFDPEDLVQSAYRCFFAGDRGDRYVLKASGDLWRLLVAITIHKVHDKATRLRAQKRALGKDQSLADEAGMAQLQGEILTQDPTPAEAAALTDELEQILRQLEPIQRKMVELRLQGFELAEIAVATGNNERTVRRIMKWLRDQLKQRCMECSGE